jgi:hypothetical protein
MLRDAEVVKLTAAAGDPRPAIIASNLKRIGVGTKVLSASINAVTALGAYARPPRRCQRVCSI